VRLRSARAAPQFLFDALNGCLVSGSEAGPFEQPSADASHHRGEQTRGGNARAIDFTNVGEPLTRGCRSQDTRVL
jgi:hypothetical protein